MTAYIVAGTQAPLGQQNHVIVVKMSELHQTENDDTGKYLKILFLYNFTAFIIQ